MHYFENTDPDYPLEAGQVGKRLGTFIYLSFTFVSSCSPNRSHGRGKLMIISLILSFMTLVDTFTVWLWDGCKD